MNNIAQWLKSKHHVYSNVLDAMKEAKSTQGEQGDSKYEDCHPNLDSLWFQILAKFKG